ncbi:MAG: riboflavin biosynthesis protein RibD [Phycisphaerae bacterium]|nr:riboflavin biosynthesis protein RibD [Phycisphaerae bacterium]
MMDDRDLLSRAARLALRGHGHAEPNPSVGCIIADRNGRIAGRGRTQRPGGPHAEVMALRQAGDDARGGTAWVTLEPCNHHGRTPPCVEALLAAGIARIVVGTVDPNPLAAGGIARLRAAGVEVVVIDDVPAVRRLHASFLHRINASRPWIIAKWAETADGDLIAPPGLPPTISSPASHRMVHRERGRVDAILTGIGTVLADDPRLDARVSRARRNPRRVVLDPDLELPPTARMLQASDGGPVMAITDEKAISRHPERADALRGLGVEILTIPWAAPASSDAPSRFARRLTAEGCRHLFEALARDHEVATILTEAGPGVLHGLFDHQLIDAALVFTSTERFEPSTGAPPHPRDRLDHRRFEIVWQGVRGGDAVAWWQRRD